MGAKAFVEFGGLAEGFGERGVRVDGAGQIRDGCAGFEGERGFGNEIARARARDGRAQQFPGAGVGEKLGDAVGAVEGQGAPAGGPREL